MAQKVPIQTVSLSVQESTNKQSRLSAPTRTHQTPNGVQSRPRSYSGSKPKLALQPVIPEADTEEESSDVKISIENGSTLRTSFTKFTPSRTNSVSSTKSAKIRKHSEMRGCENGGYDDKSSQFERGYNDSTRSSTHESYISLQVQREQYCCFARWTPFERRLALSVGILGGIIFGLAIAVGILAGNDGIDQKFVWKL
ncbi:hypothetical protein FQR65_LT01600 [Abscondita terminalis]|nr:hypothetical protein FQR65_LT01600 [Abscondita terminalis]